MKQLSLLIILLCSLHSNLVHAQVTFTDPGPNPVYSAYFTVYYSGTSAAATTSQQIPTPSAGTSTTMYFTAKLFRKYLLTGRHASKIRIQNIAGKYLFQNGIYSIK